MDAREADRMSAARKRLLQIDPFYGWPAMLLQMRERKVGTLCTDGTHLDYDPRYTSSKTMAHLIFDIAHEASHCIYLHPFRIAGRERKLANVAADYQVNEILDKGKIGEMAEGLLRDVRFDGNNFEKTYAILWEEREQQRQQQRQQPQPQDDDESDEDDSSDDLSGFPGAPDLEPDEPGDDGDEDDESDEEQDDSGQGDDADESDDESDEDGDGGDAQDDGDEDDADDLSDGGTHSYFVPAPQPEAPSDEDEDADVVPDQDSATDKPLTAEDWKKIGAQASMIAKKAGNLPLGADRAVEEARKETVDWREALRDFWESLVPTSFDWCKPDRRFVYSGSYLPGVVKENCPHLVIAVDTSGSIIPEMLRDANAEIVQLQRETRPAGITVVSVDDEIQNIEEFGPDDDVVLHFRGGGGTSFQPVFDWVLEQDEQPAAVIFLSGDLENWDHPVDPGIPVLWIAPESVRKEMPFGVKITMPVGAGY